MTSETFIFFGRSGAGKGTQALFLKERFEKKKKKVIYIETGRKFREFMLEANYTARQVKKIMDKGGLIPEFLPIWVWTDHLIKFYVGDEVLILDGLCRRQKEAPVLDSAMKFYERKNPTVLNIVVSREWSRARLLARAREDDNQREIEKRLSWYDENVLPAIEFFRNNHDYSYYEINGEQTIEKVRADILAAVALK